LILNNLNRDIQEHFFNVSLTREECSSKPKMGAEKKSAFLFFDAAVQLLDEEYAGKQISASKFYAAVANLESKSD